MYAVSLSEASSQFERLLQSALLGEEVIITTPNHQIITLVVTSKPKKARSFGSAKGLVHLADDFDAPLDDFADYM